MATLLKAKAVMEEGDFYNRWAHNRTLKNKNRLGAVTGATGSGKTYFTIAMEENYYKNVLHKPFPIENICFSLVDVAKRLESGELKSGDDLILEEGGALLGNLDFQQKLSKMFTYILQSFRSMNIGLIITLPVLSMLNKQARQLIHFHFVTNKIDFEKNISKVKPFFHQLNQQSGKSFWKYPRVRVNGRMRKITRLNYSIPSKELLIEYEKAKTKFVSSITSDFIEEYNRKENAKVQKEARKELTTKQLEVYNMACEGMTQTAIAKELGKTISSVHDSLKLAKKKGYEVVIQENA